MTEYREAAEVKEERERIARLLEDEAKEYADSGMPVTSMALEGIAHDVRAGAHRSETKES